jgi:hypothetical protein
MILKDISVIAFGKVLLQQCLHGGNKQNHERPHQKTVYENRVLTTGLLILYQKCWPYAHVHGCVAM